MKGGTFWIALCLAIGFVVTGLVAALGLIGVREEKIASLDAEIHKLSRSYQEEIEESSSQVLELQSNLATTNQRNAVLKSRLTSATEQLKQTRNRLEEVERLLKDAMVDLTASQATVTQLTLEVQNLKEQIAADDLGSVP